MPTTVHQLIEGTEVTTGASPSVTLKYFVDGAASENVSNGTIGGFTGINKDGWDYLWFLFEDKEDPNAEKVVRRPRAAYVEQIYRRGTFSGLGI